MKNINKITTIFIFLFSLFCLSACTLVAKPAAPTPQVQTTASKTGQLIIKTEEGYLLKSGTEVTTITSQKYNLDSYLKKVIEVSGMYSGKVLYVDNLKEVK